MKVILLDNVINLGKIGSEVFVRSGYARNFLFPQSKAILATKENVKMFKLQQAVLEQQITKKRVEAEALAKSINNLNNITILVRSGIEGKLFGSIGARDISNVITDTIGTRISKSQVRLPNKDVLRHVGTYNINIHIYGDIFAQLNVIISDK